VATATLSTEDTQKLKESLKRCPEGTFESAIQYRETGDPTRVPIIVNGIIERFLEPEAKPLLHMGDRSVRLFEDLGIDSLTMMEIVILVEETLNVSFDNNELRDLRTLEDIQTYMDSKATGNPIPQRAASLSFDEIAALLPQQPPFMFLSRGTVGKESASGEYEVAGGEFFLEGHFKDNPVFPASIMIEALGQLAVLFLLKSSNEQIEYPVKPEMVYFKSCDGVRCHRVCRPGDTLSMEVKLKKLRRPLAIFEGSISVGSEKAAFAEEITLAFDWQEDEDNSEPTVNGRVHSSLHASS